ncbi:MAG: FKBP-type peptidyl-prolyl cis-trans isomerase [Bdellovibrionota bacterium]
MAIQVISFHCVLKDKLGRVISSTFNNGVMSSGGPETLKALSDGMQGLMKGEKRRISLSAEQAYGFYDPKLVVVRDIADVMMSAQVKVGESIVYETGGKRGVYHITELSGDSVTLDGNHPLAGQDLVFEIEAVDAREATVAEIDETTWVDGMPALH